MSQKSERKVFSPFITRIDAPAKSDFDKYYDDVQVKEVYRKAGIDQSGEEFGVIERKLVIKKIDIAELINSQSDSVGIEAYMRALTAQGDSIDNYNTEINHDKVDDYSGLPDTLADVMMAGEKAKEVFAKMDPELKGSHTTIEGFLGSLTRDSIDSYIKGRIEALTPKQILEAKGE